MATEDDFFYNLESEDGLFNRRRRKFWKSIGLLVFHKAISELRMDRTERILTIEISDLVHDF